MNIREIGTFIREKLGNFFKKIVETLKKFAENFVRNYGLQ